MKDVSILMHMRCRYVGGLEMFYAENEKYVRFGLGVFDMVKKLWMVVALKQGLRTKQIITWI